MIGSFRSKGLSELWTSRSTAKIDSKMHRRLLVRLGALDRAERLEDLNVTGFNFHALRGHDPTRYTLHINGPWCITFEFDGKDALAVDFEQYH